MRSDIVRTMAIEQVEAHLSEIIEKLSPGEEIVVTQDNRPVARLVGATREIPRPVLGRGKGMLTILSDDDDHLKDFAEYMP
jgi:prevent-host-death family protein